MREMGNSSPLNIQNSINKDLDCETMCYLFISILSFLSSNVLAGEKHDKAAMDYVTKTYNLERKNLTVADKTPMLLKIL